MSDETARFKVIFRLQQDENGYPPVGLEGVWAERLADGTFKIDNVPFHTYEAACDDIVSAEERDGRLFFTALIQPSGNTLLRVIAYNPSTVPEIRTALIALGCQTEATGSLVAVNVPKEVDYVPVFEFLKRGMDEGRWGFEEAVLCHTEP
jgi:hypothetical protein